ncbi:MAG: hypothetical protein ABSE18_04485 [Minisyncoccia bacterium]|jgi:hypothetical protein
MSPDEYYRAKKKLALYQKSPHKTLKKNLPEFLELVITVRGHAWCMDVREERRKMAKLMASAIVTSCAAATPSPPP